MKPEVASAIFDNVGTVIAFRVGMPDAEALWAWVRQLRNRLAHCGMPSHEQNLRGRSIRSSTKADIGIVQKILNDLDTLANATLA